MSIKCLIALVTSVVLTAAGWGTDRQGDERAAKPVTQSSEVPKCVASSPKGKPIERPAVKFRASEGLTIEQLIDAAEGTRKLRVELELGAQAASFESAVRRAELEAWEQEVLETLRMKLDAVKHRSNVLRGTAPPPPPTLSGPNVYFGGLGLMGRPQ